MKLIYRKQLNSLEALKQEKVKLHYERLNTKVSDLNPLSELGRTKVSHGATSGVLGFLMELASSRSNVKTAVTLGAPILRLLRRKKVPVVETRYAVPLPRKKSLMKRLVTEVAVGYLMGKAVQMSVRGIQLYLRSKRNKKTKTIKKTMTRMR